MAIRKDTTNRKTLFRTCHICGQNIVTTADTPFMRQMTNVNGKKQATVYFCSQTCKKASYKHLFDGKAEQRRAEKEAKRDNKAKAKKYYDSHQEQCLAYARKYLEEHREEMRLACKYQRQKKKLLAACAVQ